MSSSSGVRGEEQLFKPHSRPRIIPSAKDVTISMGKHAQHMKNVEDSDYGTQAKDQAPISLISEINEEHS